MTLVVVLSWTVVKLLMKYILFTGVIDDSGIRLTITRTLRSKEVSLLEIGHKVSYKQVVPPHQKAFVSKAYCSQGCIRKVRSVLPDRSLYCFVKA